MRSRWLLAAFILTLILGILQNVAVADFWYWRYPWFDVLMHYLGGLSIAAFLVALLERFRPWAFVACFAIAVVGWEVFEYIFGVMRKSNYVFDTGLDLLLDTVGAITIYLFARLSIWRSK